MFVTFFYICTTCLCSNQDVFFFQASENFEGNKTEVCQIEEENGIQSETSKQDLMHFIDNETLEQCKKNIFFNIHFLKKNFWKKE